MKSAAARPSESVDDGNFHGKLEPSVPILFISLLQIRDGSEALLGTPSSFLLLPAPRVGHMWATGLQDLLQGCPGVAQPGLLWSSIRACQEMISSSSRSGPTFAHPALLDRDRPRLISSWEEAACSRESRIPSALPLQHWIQPRGVPYFQVGVKGSQQSDTKGWKPAGTPWPALFPSFHSSQTKAFLIPCSLKDSFTTGSRSTQDRKEITNRVMDG